MYLQKGPAGGSGAYRGAHWHTTQEIRALFDGLPAANRKVRSAEFLAGGGPIARGIEHLISHRLSLGGFVVVAGDVRGQTKLRRMTVPGNLRREVDRRLMAEAV